MKTNKEIIDELELDVEDVISNLKWSGLNAKRSNNLVAYIMKIALKALETKDAENLKEAESINGLMPGRSFFLFQKFIAEVRKGRSVVYAMPEGNLYSPKAIKELMEEKDDMYKQAMRKLIEDIPFQGRIEDAADFKNRLSEWKKEKLTQLQK